MLLSNKYLIILLLVKQQCKTLYMKLMPFFINHSTMHKFDGNVGCIFHDFYILQKNKHHT